MDSNFTSILRTSHGLELHLNTEDISWIQTSPQHPGRLMDSNFTSTPRRSHGLKLHLNTQVVSWTQTSPQHPGHLMDSNFTSTPRRSHGLKLHLNTQVVSWTQTSPQHPGHLTDSNFTSTPRTSHWLKLHLNTQDISRTQTSLLASCIKTFTDFFVTTMHILTPLHCTTVVRFLHVLSSLRFIKLITVALWNRADQNIFSSCGFCFLLFLRYFPRLISGFLPYFHTWCGLSVNLRCRSETCCTRLDENT